MTRKREYGTTDAAPRVLYGKIDVDSEHAYPILINSDGTLRITSGFAIAQFDEIDLTYTDGNITKAVYLLAGATMATLTLTYAGNDLTKVVKS
jgi:hypothetical protein